MNQNTAGFKSFTKKCTYEQLSFLKSVYQTLKNMDEYSISEKRLRKYLNDSVISEAEKTTIYEIVKTKRGKAKVDLLKELCDHIEKTALQEDEIDIEVTEDALPNLNFSVTKGMNSESTTPRRPPGKSGDSMKSSLTSAPFRPDEDGEEEEEDTQEEQDMNSIKNSQEAKMEIMKCLEGIGKQIESWKSKHRRGEVENLKKNLSICEDNTNQIYGDLEEMLKSKLKELGNVESLNHKCNTLELELRNQLEVIEGLEETNQQLSEKIIKHLMYTNEEDRAKVQKLVAEIDFREAEVEKREQAMSNMAHQMNTLVKETDDKAKKLEIKLRAEEKKNKWLWSTIERMKEEKELLVKSHKEQEELRKQELRNMQFSDTQSMMDAQSVMMDMVEKEKYDEVKHKFSALKKNFKTLNADYEKVSAEAAKWEKLEDEYEAEKEKNADEILKLQLKIEGLEESVEDKEQQVASIQIEIEEIKKQLEEITTENEELKKKYKEAKHDANDRLFLPRASNLLIKAGRPSMPSLTRFSQAGLNKEEDDEEGDDFSKMIRRSRRAQTFTYSNFLLDQVKELEQLGKQVDAKGGGLPDVIVEEDESSQKSPSLPGGKSEVEEARSDAMSIDDVKNLMGNHLINLAKKPKPKQKQKLIEAEAVVKEGKEPIVKPQINVPEPAESQADQPSENGNAIEMKKKEEPEKLEKENQDQLEVMKRLEEESVKLEKQKKMNMLYRQSGRESLGYVYVDYKRMTKTAKTLSNKESYDLRKDYLNVSHNFKVLEKMISRGAKDPDGKCLSDDVYIFDKKLKRRRRKLVITQKYVFSFATNSKKDTSAWTIKSQHSLKYLKNVILSSKNSTIAAFTFKKGADFLLDSCRRLDIVLYIAQVMKMNEKRKFKIIYMKNFDFMLNKENSVMSPELCKTVTEYSSKIIEKAPKDAKIDMDIVNKQENKRLPVLQETLRNARMSGFLRIRKSVRSFFSSKKVFKEYFFILTDIGLLYFKNYGDTNPKGFLPILGSKTKLVTDKDIYGREGIFTITFPGFIAILQGKGKMDTEEWVTKIKGLQEQSKTQEDEYMKVKRNFGGAIENNND